MDALTGRAQPLQRAMLGLQLERLQLIDWQIAKLNSMIAQAMKPHQDAVIRLAEVPGLGVDSAQQVIAEVGAQASTFPSAADLSSWVGTCPGKEESAEENHSSRSAKGNKYLRRVLNQAAHAAVTKKGSYFQAVFRHLLPRLISRPSGPSLIGSAVWFGRSCMRACDLSSKAANLIPGPRRNALRCWREPHHAERTGGRFSPRVPHERPQESLAR